MNLGNRNIDDLLTFTVATHTPSTGAATDADAVPAYRVYEDETGTAILTGNMAKLDDSNTTGHYSEQITLSAANGFEVGKSYNIYISAAVSSVTGVTVRQFQVVAVPATASALATAQTDLDTITGSDGVTLATAQGNYAPATATALASLVTTVGVAGAGLTAVLTTSLTESYRSTGAAGTAAQLLYETMAHVGEFAISGTTKTTKKLDGSTTAKVYTLDDATNPTSITETT